MKKVAQLREEVQDVSELHALHESNIPMTDKQADTDCWPHDSFLMLDHFLSDWISAK